LSVSQMFEDFCRAIPLSVAKRTSVASRTATITRRLNSDFRSSASDTDNRFYAGSYGRNTAIATISDIDLMYVLPYSTYVQYDAYTGNKQSALLQAVRNSLNTTYPNSAVVADGQVVKIAFVDNITYEIVPVFKNTDDSYTFPDANNGGSWRTCKPKHEISAFAKRDIDCNRNLVELGRMVRAWRDYNSVKMSGMLIDTLAYQFIAAWPHRDKSYLYFDYMTRDFFDFLGRQDRHHEHWTAPGSGSWVHRTGAFELSARNAHALALDAVANLAASQLWAAKSKYRQIYGTQFPS
jgi:Second Messenger Oligonucleotide or Dinucleotide Synthetase domain